MRDPARPELIWKLTPWEKAEDVMPELDVYARLGAFGRSEGLVALREVAGTADHLARAYDYAPHGELARFLRDERGEPRPPEPTVTRGILAQIASAMAGLHARGIMHRDLKAENVLVFADGPDPEVRIADFDRAIALPPGSRLHEPVGSLFHMAPELLAWQPYDHRVDVYAFGILIHEVANGGARPFPQVATGLPGTMTAEEFGAKVKTQGLRPDWRSPDLELRDLAYRCLAADPDQRPDFAEIHRALTGISLPVTPVQSQSGCGVQGIGMAATIGRQRPAMEDALCVLDAGGYQILAVFDGLRGDRASRFAAHSLALMLKDALSREAPAAAIRHAFVGVQARLRRLDPAVTSGTTATVVVIGPESVDIGWTGDSPAWSIDKVAPSPLIRAHHPTSEPEAARVTAAGGAVRRETRMMDSGEMVPWGPLRVYGADGAGGIALTRALGLPALTPAISHEPEILDLPPAASTGCLVLASDGVGEVLSVERLAEICTLATTPQAAADAIMEEVLRLGAPDNASVIVRAMTG
ncbi:protein kinase [Paracoccus caeni]|uniref:Protein kinase n=1 Tax=Paracoccus caeni TaxID=657651 RepID=A0A934SFG7_9RHOB|nr:bifunctional serine/threonine-protein kinase/phosphatase [Paracoccus caeni]MBK4216698.1 protein kinase [Paracoccus caeni]